MIMYVYYNANPSGKATGDCVIRAIATVTDLPWRTVHWELAALSNEMYQMMDDNVVWHEYLRRLGFDINTVQLPTPRPAYVVQNPNCCATQTFGCGCGAM